MILVHIQKMYNIFRKLVGVWSSGLQQYFFFFLRGLARALSESAFQLFYSGINSMWKSISEKRQCSRTKNRHNAQHNKHKSIKCATKRIKARPAALIIN